MSPNCVILIINKYFNHFQPRNLSELYFINESSQLLDDQNPYNRFYPWHTPYPPPEHQDFFFGPKIYQENEVKIRTYRLNNIYDLVSKYGYIPDERDCIKGYIISNESDYRFVVTAGHHRSSVLNAMNKIENAPLKVPVKFDHTRVKNKNFLINLENINNWPAVKSGFLKKEEAETFFKSFFIDKDYI